MLYSTIGHKCIEGDIIEINLLSLCNVSRVLNDIIDSSDDSISVIDELHPNLNKKCLEAFKLNNISGLVLFFGIIFIN